MRAPSGLTEKKLTFEGPPGTVVTSSICPRRGDPTVGSTSDRILASPYRKNTLSAVALTGGCSTAPMPAPQLRPDEGATDALAAVWAFVSIMSSRVPAR